MFFEMNWQHRIPVRETSNDFMIDLRRKQNPHITWSPLSKSTWNPQTGTKHNNDHENLNQQSSFSLKALLSWCTRCQWTLMTAGGLWPNGWSWRIVSWLWFASPRKRNQQNFHEIHVIFMGFREYLPWIPTEFPEFQWISWDFHEYLLEKYGKMANRSLIVHWFSIFTWHASQR